jgi:hypothetical protein
MHRRLAAAALALLALAAPLAPAAHAAERSFWNRADMDTTCAPCRDFYQFAEGGWLANTKMPAGYSSYGGFEELADRNEAVINFIRASNLPRATIRAHLAAGQLTLFATDGGGIMKNFLRGVNADDDNKDDPQVIFVPKQ